ncbi:GNAT family N-acetyltransferase [Paucibacter sp. KBW04]|uniref:GNAT family N-acetyltransferase n=1 Tax=Paucibacter sp. KBW04 TaxID=2153361 RepID=UPI001E2E87A8|nr:GNAT family N-acetyltransferase [Paucibacter sp. KBW04]
MSQDRLPPVSTGRMGFAPGQLWVSRGRAVAQPSRSETAAFSIRRERADQPEVQALIAALDAYQNELYPAANNHLLPLTALMQPQVRLLVVRDAQQRAVACGALVLHEDHAELKRMMVAPEQRGLGLGSLLVSALQKEALAAGRHLLRLETGVRQPAAQRLYERMGFERCGPFGNYRADPFSLFMEKLLTS